MRSHPVGTVFIGVLWLAGTLAATIDFSNSSLDPASDPDVLWSINASPTDILASLYIDTANNDAITMGFKGENISTEPESDLVLVVTDSASNTLMAITGDGDVWVKESLNPGIPFPLD